MPALLRFLVQIGSQKFKFVLSGPDLLKLTFTNWKLNWFCHQKFTFFSFILIALGNVFSHWILFPATLCAIYQFHCVWGTRFMPFLPQSKNVYLILKMWFFLLSSANSFAKITVLFPWTKKMYLWRYLEDPVKLDNVL